MRRLYIVLASVVIATLLIAVASSTGASAFPSMKQKENYGAIAFSPSTHFSVGAYGLTEKQAEHQAFKVCARHANDCHGSVWVHNGWMALAGETIPAAVERVPYNNYDDPAYGWGWADSQSQAEADALYYCGQDAPQYGHCSIERVGETPAHDPEYYIEGGSWY